MFNGVAAPPLGQQFGLCGIHQVDPEFVTMGWVVDHDLVEDAQAVQVGPQLLGCIEHSQGDFHCYSTGVHRTVLRGLSTLNCM